MQHTVELYCAVHALIPNVLSPAVTSTHHRGVDIEAAIKRGDIPTPAEFASAISGMNLGEQHHLIACYIAWADEANYQLAMATMQQQLPHELYLAAPNERTFDDASREDEDRYDTFSYTPPAWRTVAKIRRGEVQVEKPASPSKDSDGSTLYAWLDRASRSGLPDVEHAARVLKDYYEGVDSDDPRSLTQKAILANANWRRYPKEAQN
jgi:hypothetical protein